jgi:hypothetical protein
MSVIPAVSHAGVFVSITIAPPVLPVYVQPPLPAEGYLWTPGYWAYGDAGYFWVPGVWVQPPSVGLLWTPGYWGWHGGVYAWNAGYWGPHIGFYGGVNYGFGYGGVGFAGGRWEGGHFAYNGAVANFGGVVVHNSYHENVVVNNVHTSFNGGEGGLRAQPGPAERAAMAEHHIPPTGVQNAHHEAASHDRSQLASVNHGRPANAAMSRPMAANHAAAANHPGGAANHAGAPGNRGGAPASHAGTPANRAASPANHGATPGGANHSAAPVNHAAQNRPAAPASHSAPAANHSAPAGGHPAGGGGAKGSPHGEKK